MAWLAKLDAKAATWPPIWQGLYLVIKYGLAGLGAFALLGVWADRLGLWDMYGH